jgi:hypothetical protein
MKRANDFYGYGLDSFTLERRVGLVGFMNKEEWKQIYDIARYNGVAAHQLVVELNAANPNADEEEIVKLAKEWSQARTAWPTN